MSSKALCIRETLYSAIRSVSAVSWLFARSPGRDFTRNVKLPFAKLITLILSLKGSSITCELMEHFGCTKTLVSEPAFVKRRGRLLPEALETIFRLFVENTRPSNRYKGFQLLAVDGSDLHTPTNPDDIGHVRIDFGRGGDRFCHTWHPRGPEELNTQGFKDELTEVVDELRESVLKNFSAMTGYCRGHGGEISGGWVQNYGYVIETENYRYCLRCNPLPGDYQAYLTCFDKRVQEMNQAEDKRPELDGESEGLVPLEIGGLAALKRAIKPGAELMATYHSKPVQLDEKGYRKFSMRDSLAYAAGDFGCNMSFALKGTMVIFWTQFMRMNSLVYAALLLVCQVWDAINAPLLGTIIDADRRQYKRNKFLTSWTSCCFLFQIFLNRRIACDIINGEIHPQEDNSWSWFSQKAEFWLNWNA